MVSPVRPTTPKIVATRTPLRVSFAGGGTDLADFYERDHGAVLSTATDKYIFVTVKRHSELFNEPIRVNYSLTEQVDTIDEIQNNIARESLKLLKSSPPFTSSTWAICRPQPPWPARVVSPLACSTPCTLTAASGLLPVNWPRKQLTSRSTSSKSPSASRTIHRRVRWPKLFPFRSRRRGHGRASPRQQQFPHGAVRPHPDVLDRPAARCQLRPLRTTPEHPAQTRIPHEDAPARA